MKNGLRISLALFLLINTTSCANYIMRKGCEKVNWFQHAHDVAMRGQRLEEDDRLKQCEKAETEINSAELDRGFKQGMENYCKLETAHEKGSNGDMFNYDFCDNNLVSKLKARHRDGLNKFCQPDSAFTFASKGGIYKNQCPKDMENAFMGKYRKGRQIYLKNQILGNEANIVSIDGEIRDLQSRRYEVSNRISSLPRTTVVTRSKQYDPATKTYKEQTAVTEDPEIKRMREDLERSLNSISGQISDKQNEQRRLREQIGSYKSELESLN